MESDKGEFVDVGALTHDIGINILSRTLENGANMLLEWHMEVRYKCCDFHG